MPLEPKPRIKLSKLRDIGWELWDPIGLLASDGLFQGKWTDAENTHFVDEYDTYLISAASQLKSGSSKETVAAYLEHIATHHMGLAKTDQGYENAKAVVEAILSEPDLWTYPDSRGNFR